jgi:signal peptidase I
VDHTVNIPATTGITTAPDQAQPAPSDRREGGGEGEHPSARRPGAAGGGRRALVEWATILAVAVIAALIIRTFVFQAFFIPSQSMEPTIWPGDRVLVNKLAHDLGPVHTGEIIVFRRPPRDTSTDDDLIKRVIAGPGEKIYVANCRVYVDGHQLSQTYLPAGWENPSSEYCTVWDAPGMLNLPDPYTVPAGHYFVMGDNRKDSDDSRYWGPVPESYIVGVAFVRVWPLSRARFF